MNETICAGQLKIRVALSCRKCKKEDLSDSIRIEIPAVAFSCLTSEINKIVNEKIILPPNGWAIDGRDSLGHLQYICADCLK